MKHLSTLDVSIDGSLRVNRRTLVLTGHMAHPSPSEVVIEKEQASSNHITVREVDNSDSEIELAETLKTLEDGGQATVDELKELNLRTPEEPRPIYVSSLLTSEEEKEYFDLLGEYKDMFAWSYQEMLGLDPKIVVHRLSIKKGVSPKKQPQRRFRPELIPETEKEVSKLIEVGFIYEVKYPTWIANIVPVRKKWSTACLCRFSGS